MKQPVRQDKWTPHSMEELAALLLHELVLEKPEIVRRPVRKDEFQTNTMNKALQGVKLP